MAGSSQNRKPGSATKAPQSALSTLDFAAAGGDVARALAECAGKIEVQEGGDAFAGVSEDAAVLYANGQNDIAAQVLLEFVSDLSPGQGETVWMMLLDLYRLSGKRAEFDEQVINYARSFEKSPPPWGAEAGPDAGAKAAMPAVALGAALNEQVAKQFDRVRDAARKAGGVRLDLSRVRSADEAGCGHLRQLQADLKEAAVKVRIVGAASLANMLRGQVQAGRRENQQMWLLLLDLLQHTENVELFEEVALDYAITYEESPPSREPHDVTQLASTTAELAAAVQMHEGFSLEGDVLGANAEPVRQLAAFASDRSRVDVDCSKLRRLDFVCAGSLFNVFAQLQGQGKLIVLKDVNAMVAALLRVMGIDQVARLQLRR